MTWRSLSLSALRYGSASWQVGQSVSKKTITAFLPDCRPGMTGACSACCIDTRYVQTTTQTSVPSGRRCKPVDPGMCATNSNQLTIRTGGCDKKMKCGVCYWYGKEAAR